MIRTKKWNFRHFTKNWCIILVNNSLYHEQIIHEHHKVKFSRNMLFETINPIQCLKKATFSFLFWSKNEFSTMFPELSVHSKLMLLVKLRNFAHEFLPCSTFYFELSWYFPPSIFHWLFLHLYSQLSSFFLSFKLQARIYGLLQARFAGFLASNLYFFYSLS